MSPADIFNLLDAFNLLRVVCAVFFIPHIIGKFSAGSAQILCRGRFQAAGLLCLVVAIHAYHAL